MLTPIFIRRIPVQTQKVVTYLCKSIPLATDIRHNIKVYVAPSQTVGNHDGVGFGAFHPKRMEIWMGGQPPSEFRKNERPRFLSEVFAHEIAHYEQWRDGRPLTERGVNVRARNLLKLARSKANANRTKNRQQVRPLGRTRKA